MTLLCNNNRENRRTVLQMSVWQEWLIAMAYIHPKNSEEQKLSDMVYSLFRMLLHHAIKHEYGGWRVWVDTLAIVHSKVSYEEFKLQFAQMYEHYERHRADNITDPALRQSHPISTISGWERGRQDHNHSVQQQTDKEITDEEEHECNHLNKIDENHIDSPTPPLSGNATAATTIKCDCENIEISNISAVFNSQISNVSIEKDDEDDSQKFFENSDEISDDKNSTESISIQEDVLIKQALEINSLEENQSVTDESETVVKKIVDEILEKSEKLLDECQNELIIENQSTSPVIKDEEIEFAVNEVVKGVRKIEEMQKNMNNNNNAPTILNDELTENKNNLILNNMNNNNANKNKINDNEKTDTNIIPSAIINNNKMNNNENVNMNNGDNEKEVEEMISDIVNEIIDTCVESVKKNNTNENSDNINNNTILVNDHHVEEKINGNDTISHADNNIDVDDDDVDANNAEEDIAVKNQIQDVVEDILTTAVNTAESKIKSKVDECVIEDVPNQDTKCEDNNEKFEDIPMNNHTEVYENHVRVTDNGNQTSTVNSPQTRPNIATTSTQVDSAHIDSTKRHKSASTRPMFSPGPTRPPFRIPEFKWSYIHQRLLSDVLFSLETDIQVS